MSAVSTQPSFFKSFIKGSFFSLLILAFFALWAFLKGPEFIETMMEETPSIVIPVSGDAGMMVPDHHETSNQVSEHKNENHTQDITEHHAAQEHNTREHDTNKEAVKLYKESLVEESQFGLLPKIDVASGNTPFQQYKRNFILPSGQKKFQLVLGPLGFSKELATKIANELPQDITVLISPYSDHASDLVEIFKTSGQEVWLLLPTETNKEFTIDSGPLALRSDYSRNKNLSLYKRILGRTTGYVGLFVNQADQSTLSFSSARMEELQADIYQRGLGLAYLSNMPMTDLSKIGKDQKGELRHVANYFENIFPIARESWDNMISEQNNISILYSPYPNDISMLSDFLKTLPEKGYVLTPLSAK